MAKGFGSLGVAVRGVILYKLSPMEQRAFAGALRHGVGSFAQRVYSQIFKVVPPFALAYLIYDWGEKENVRLSRKDPKEFENDQ